MKRLLIILLMAILLCHNAYAGFNGYLKADTQVIVTVGPFVDVGDGFTPQTDIGLAGNEAELLKHGSTSVVDISGATWAAVTNCRGYYSLTLTTSHTDTEGQLTVIVQDDSDCLPVRNTFMVVNANVFDSLFAAATTDYLQVDTIQVTGTSQTANDMSGDIDAILIDTGTTLDDLIDTEIGTIVTAVGNIETDTAAYDTDAEYATAIWNAATNAYGGAGTYGQAAEDILVDTSTTLDDFIDTEIGTIVTAVGNIETDTAAYDTDAEYATAIWNAATNAYGGAGTYGQAAEDILVDTSTTLDDFLDTEIAAIVAAVITNAAGVDIAADIIAVKAETASILTDTGTTLDDFLDTEIAAILADTGTDGVVVASVNADAIEAGDFKTGAIDADALNADAVTEIWTKAMSDLAAGAPSATASVLTAINYLYEAWRNQTWATSTEIAIYKDDATTKMVESTISDDGTTFKRGEMRTVD